MENWNWRFLSAKWTQVLSDNFRCCRTISPRVVVCVSRNIIITLARDKRRWVIFYKHFQLEKMMSYFIVHTQKINGSYTHWKKKKRKHWKINCHNGWPPNCGRFPICVAWVCLGGSLCNDERRMVPNAGLHGHLYPIGVWQQYIWD